MADEGGNQPDEGCNPRAIRWTISGPSVDHQWAISGRQQRAIKSNHPTSRVPLRFSIPKAWAGCSEAASSASTREQPVNLRNRRMHSSKGKTVPASVSVPGRTARPSEVT